MPQKIKHYGIDTSVFLRLLTGDPEDGYRQALAALIALIEANPLTEISVSNIVIGEAYIALQHHYKVGKISARKAIITVLNSGLLTPLNGAEVLELLEETTGCGLIDRLIANDYEHRSLTTLTLDKKMSGLPSAQRL